jgi:TRAP-type C4-dicarboxylate transport system substrate-binding protein
MRRNTGLKITFSLFILIPILLLAFSMPAIAAGKPMILKFAHPIPGPISSAKGWYWWAEEVEKKTKGRIKIEFYPGGTLFKIEPALDSIISGVADIGMISLGVTINRLPLLGVTGLPLLGFPDTPEGNYAAGQALLDLHDNFPEVQAECKDFILLLPQFTSNHNLVCKNKVVRVPSDVKGLKVGGTGKKAALMDSLGAASIAVSPPDSYMSIDKAVLDGVFLGWSHSRIYKIHEVAKVFLDFGFSQSGIPVIMNLKSWNKLSPADQKLMLSLTPEARKRSAAANMKGVMKGKKMAKDAGATITTLTAEEKKLWEKAAEPIWTAWINDMNKRGLKNADKVLAAWKQMRDAASK